MAESNTIAGPLPPIRLAAKFSSAALCDALNTAFEGYVVPMHIPLDHWDKVMASQSLLLDQSFAIGTLPSDGDNVSEKVFAFVFIDRFEGESKRTRIAAMGAVPEVRGTGAAGMLMDKVIEEARARGEKTVELECFVQNERALRLYQKKGFRTLYELWGYFYDYDMAATAEDTAQDSTSADTLAGYCVDAHAAGEWLDHIEATRAVQWLPFQCGPNALRASPGSFQLYRTGSALLMARVVPEGEKGMILVVDTDQEQRDARTLVRAYLAANRGKMPGVKVMALQREDLGGRALLEEGFKEEELRQVLMVREL